MPDSPTPEPTRRDWLLRRADQAAVAVLVLAGLLATVAWWISQGGLQCRLIDIDRSDPQTCRFQLDLNAADWPELAELPEIGPTLAHRIVENRQTGGPFRTPDDLRRVPGIGPKTLEAIRPYLLPMAHK